MLIESSKYKGFYKSKLFEDLSFSECGIIINEKEDFCYLPVFGMFGNYLVFRYNKETHIVHRTMAKVFHNLPVGEFDDYFVNHKNGIKTDNHKDNIEWCTASENALHAYKTGLRNDNRVIYIRCLKTKEVVEYYSLWEAARTFKVNGGTIVNYLNSDRSLPFRHFWSVWTKDLPEVLYTDEQMLKIKHGLPKTVVVELFKEDKVYVFDSASYAADHFNVKRATLRLWINDGKYHNNIRLWYIHDYKENKEFDKTFKRYDEINKNRKPMPSKPAIPVEVKDMRDNTVTPYISTQEFADKIGVKKNTIQKSALINNGFWKHYHLKYITR